MVICLETSCTVLMGRDCKKNFHLLHSKALRALSKSFKMSALIFHFFLIYFSPNSDSR